MKHGSAIHFASALEMRCEMPTHVPRFFAQRPGFCSVRSLAARRLTCERLQKSFHDPNRVSFGSGIPLAERCPGVLDCTATPPFANIVPAQSQRFRDLLGAVKQNACASEQLIVRFCLRKKVVQAAMPKAYGGDVRRKGLEDARGVVGMNHQATLRN